MAGAGRALLQVGRGPWRKLHRVSPVVLQLAVYCALSRLHKTGAVRRRYQVDVLCCLYSDNAPRLTGIVKTL